MPVRRSEKEVHYPVENDAQLLQRTQSLIASGQALFRYHPTDSYKSQPLPILLGSYTMWRTQCLTFLVGVLGDHHVYSSEFSNTVLPAVVDTVLPSWVTTGLGILAALCDDLKNGHVTNFRALVAAEVFTDFLAQADYFIEQGYKMPAAAVCGAVLEDGLRQIAALKRITVKASDDLSALNHKCAQANVYSRLTQKKIQVWTDVRNKADHGQFTEYTDDDVRDMLSGVRSFVSDHLR